MCFNVKSSTFYFHIKTKILADFQICISVCTFKLTCYQNSIDLVLVKTCISNWDIRIKNCDSNWIEYQCRLSKLALLSSVFSQTVSFSCLDIFVSEICSAKWSVSVILVRWLVFPKLSVLKTLFSMKCLLFDTPSTNRGLLFFFTWNP